MYKETLKINFNTFKQGLIIMFNDNLTKQVIENVIPKLSGFFLLIDDGNEIGVQRRIDRIIHDIANQFAFRAGKGRDINAKDWNFTFDKNSIEEFFKREYDRTDTNSTTYYSKVYIRGSNANQFKSLILREELFTEDEVSEFYSIQMKAMELFVIKELQVLVDEIEKLSIK